MHVEQFLQTCDDASAGDAEQDACDEGVRRLFRLRLPVDRRHCDRRTKVVRGQGPRHLPRGHGKWWRPRGPVVMLSVGYLHRDIDSGRDLAICGHLRKRAFDGRFARSQYDRVCAVKYVVTAPLLSDRG
jgi:hypothetical protein